MALLVFWKHALLVLGYGIGFELLSCTKTKEIIGKVCVQRFYKLNVNVKGIL